MPETTTPIANVVEAPIRFDPVARGRLRALSRDGVSPKALVKSVTPFEIAALVVLVLLIVGTFVVYSFWILPDQVNYVRISNQVSANQSKIQDLQQTIVDPSTLTSHFQEVRDSLDQFRGATLKPRLAGRREILDAIDQSTRETGVALASPVSFETRVSDSTAAKKTNNKVRSTKASDDDTVRSYPALQMTFSVTGSYDQLRRFISRFEASGQFVVIDAVQLNVDERDDDAGPRGRGRPAAPAGAITLDLSMTAYFQPEPSEMASVATGQ